MKSLVFGEVLWDVYGDEMHIGGAPFNFAAHFNKCGGKSTFLTAVGKDSLGEDTIKQISKQGISADYILFSEKETGKCVVTLNENGIPSYNILSDVAYDYIKKPDLKGEKYNLLYFGTLALRGISNRTIIGEIINENSFDDIFVDINIRLPHCSTEVVNFAMKNATIVKISDEELPTVMNYLNEENLSTEKCAELIGKIFEKLRLVIITLGEKGSMCYDVKKREFHYCKAKEANVVSTVGAGDSFSAAFLSKYLQGGDIDKALDFASAISAYVVSSVDAIPEYKLSDLSSI